MGVLSPDDGREWMQQPFVVQAIEAGQQRCQLAALREWGCVTVEQFDDGSTRLRVDSDDICTLPGRSHVSWHRPSSPRSPWWACLPHEACVGGLAATAVTLCHTLP